MGWFTNILFAVAGSAVMWAGSRYYFFLSAAAARKSVTASERLGIFVVSLGTFPVWLEMMIWPMPLDFADASILRWALVCSPFVAFYYGLYRFWMWRRDRLIAKGSYQRAQYVLKPQSVFGWFVYIYVTIFFLWQAVHWLAPSWLPSWIR